MATVNQSKRTPGKWVLRYQAEGKQRLRTFHSKKAADKARREIEHEIDMGIHAADADSVTFGEVARAFLIDCQRRQRHRRQWQRSTVHSYTNKIELYAPYLAEMRLVGSKQKQPRLSQNGSTSSERHYAAETVHGAYQTVFGVMSFAVSQGWIKRNILRDDPIKNLPRLSKRANIPRQRGHTTPDQRGRAAGAERKSPHISQPSSFRLSLALTVECVRVNGLACNGRIWISRTTRSGSSTPSTSRRAQGAKDRKPAGAPLI